MKTKMKAALYSGLVYPGSGQIYLKRYGLGLLLAGVTSVLVYLMLRHVTVEVSQMILQLEDGTLSVEDLGALERAIHEIGYDARMKLLGSCLGGLWLVSLLDIVLRPIKSEVSTEADE